MRPVQTHLSEALAALRPVPPLDVVLADAAGCILAEDVLAPADVPARDVALHDGYAVRHDDVYGAADGGAVSLPVVQDVWSGAVEPVRLVPGQAIRVSTGVPVPLGADTVLPLEVTDRGTATVRVLRPSPAGAGVRHAAADVVVGQVAIAAGVRLGARQISLAAALGRQRLRVHPRPRVVILPVGSELIEPGRRGDGIYNANGQALAIAVQDAGAVAIPVAAVSDDRATLREMIEDQLVRADLLITTGGLSEGTHDTLKDVLGPLGTVRFDHVAVSPGRHQGFGMLGEGEGQVPIFALPGQPVAAQISYEVFVRPALRAMAGKADLFRPSVAAYADVAWSSPADVRQFVPAHLVGSPDEGYRVTPVGDPATLDQLSLSALSDANALAVVPEHQTFVQLGERVNCLVLEG